MRTSTKTLHESFSRLDAALCSTRTNGIELDIANSLWPQNDDAFRAEFIDLLRQDYRATVTPLDYVHQREQARATINKWVDEKTHHKITAAIPPNTLSTLTSLVLVNAIYFKGEWDTAFPAHATHPDHFYPSPARAITIPFMLVEGHFGFGEDEDLQWLSLPYKGNRFQMVILLPRAGGIMEKEFGRTGRGNGQRQRGSDTLEGLERALNPAKFAAWTASLRPQKVAVTIPRFRISCGLRVNGALQALGVKDAFNPEHADFSGMDGRPHRLYLSDALHQTFIEVNEKGTEAAAASEMAMTKSSPAMFYADHPLLFFIRETATGSILFMGRVAVPDYFLIERAVRTPRPMTNNPYWQRRPPGGLPSRALTNRPPNFPQGFGRPGWQREDPFVTGPFQVVARSIGQPGVHDYRYVETNVDTLFQPLYRIQPHYSPPLHAYLDQVNTTGIRNTIISVTAQPTTNGYVLTVPHPIPYAWYLLLVRDKNDPQWRASGYFASGTNRSPVHLHVDKRGMMSEGQSPIAMPEVKFLPDVVEPEFVAGWGEDSDGDGLPDVYEVLVTHTEPDNADTGETGILDGYKELTSDGWNNLEKFRRRVDPLRPAYPPPTVELKQPTAMEIMKALTPTTDLSCESEIEVRTNGTVRYLAIEKAPQMLSKILNYRQPSEHRPFDLRISWRFAEPKPRQFDGRAPAAYQSLEPLLARINLQLFEAFNAMLTNNPPLSRTETSNTMAAIMAAAPHCQPNSISTFFSSSFSSTPLTSHGLPIPKSNA